MPHVRRLLSGPLGAIPGVLLTYGLLYLGLGLSLPAAFIPVGVISAMLVVAYRSRLGGLFVGSLATFIVFSAAMGMFLYATRGMGDF